MSKAQRIGKVIFSCAMASFLSCLAAKHNFLDVGDWFAAASFMTGIAAFAGLIVGTVTILSE